MSESAETHRTACSKCGQVHQRCSGHRGDGSPCGKHSMHGMRVCATHGGSSPQARAAAEKRLAEREVSAELSRLGVPLKVDPLQTLLECVWESAGNVAWLRSRIQEMQEPTQGEIVLVTALAALLRSPRDKDAPPLDGASVEHADWTRRLYGPNHQGDTVLHVLLQLYNSERERLARFSKLCVDAGVQTRHLQLVEEQASKIANVITAILADPALSLTEKQREVGRAVAGKHLRVLAT